MFVLLFDIGDEAITVLVVVVADSLLKGEVAVPVAVAVAAVEPGDGNWPGADCIAAGFVSNVCFEMTTVVVFCILSCS